jgi:hypothetical protein
MLGVEYQTINCDKQGCPYNERHVVKDGDNRIVEIYYTCEKKEININWKGQCEVN